MVHINCRYNHDAAIKTLETAIDKFPTEWELWDRLRGTYKANGDHDAAIKTFEAAVDKFPMELGLWDQLSDAYKLKSDHDTVIKTLKDSHRHSSR